MTRLRSRLVPPVILFGAFDRHNLGDLLFPRVLAHALAPTPCRCAGLVARDLRPFGGHKIRAIGELLSECSEVAAVVHAGGELLDCDAWEAAVMTLPPGKVTETIARLDANPPARLHWAAQQLGRSDLAPYLYSPSESLPDIALCYQAVGGVALASRSAAFRAEVLSKLASARYLSVRDDVTRDFLAREGIAAALVPDSAVLTAELFGRVIRSHGRQGALARLRRAYPEGYVAMQFSADFGDDATLDALAAQLGPHLKQRRLGLVLFRAGAAPWHDDLAVYRRLVKRLAVQRVHLFAGRHIWDLAALLAGARLFCGSSLHGRIVATAFGVPGVSLVPDPLHLSKQLAYLQTWQPDHERLVGPAGLGRALAAALDSEPIEPELSQRLVAQARAGLQALVRHIAG